MKKKLPGKKKKCHLEYSEPLHRGGKRVDGLIIIGLEQSRVGTCVLFAA